MPRRAPKDSHPEQYFSLQYRSRGRGCAILAWIGIALAVIGIALTIVFGMGWAGISRPPSKEPAAGQSQAGRSLLRREAPIWLYSDRHQTREKVWEEPNSFSDCRGQPLPIPTSVLGGIHRN
jgi:hypothetical protein